MRLIDADKLIEDMKNELEKAVNEENMNKNDCLVIMTSAIALKDFVNRQPTVYDVAKVIKQLDELVKINMDVLGVRADYVNLAHVIKKVKRGGLDEN